MPGQRDGAPWQIGAKEAGAYGRLAREAAHAMRRMDDRLELAACGSSNHEMPSYAHWKHEVLDACFEEVDHISPHTYVDRPPGDVAAHLEHAERLDAYIAEVTAVADAVAATRRSPRRIMLSLDEWNAWYRTRWPSQEALRRDVGPEWPERPRLIEETYDMADALMVGAVLVTMLNRRDRVRTAC